MSANHIKRVAIVGGSGQMGSHIVEALSKAGRFEITALTRPDSTNTMPNGVNHVAKADYDDKPALVAALKGQDCLIITMNVMAPPDSQQKLIDAALEAGVPWVLPNEWGFSSTDPDVIREIMIGDRLIAARNYIASTGKMSYVAVSCGFWYEYSLTTGSWAYGFDWENKKVTFYDRGETPLNTSTWPKTAEAVAKLLSLPIQKEEGGDRPCLNDFKNQSCFVSSFRLTQRDMLDSILRVTGAKQEDWTVEYEDVKERYARGMTIMRGGSREGFGMCLYSRLFWPDAPGDFNSKVHNDVLGLEQEDLDTRTKIAVEMSKTKK